MTLLAGAGQGGGTTNGGQDGAARCVRPHLRQHPEMGQHWQPRRVHLSIIRLSLQCDLMAARRV
jgi:hypothetical protein